MISSVDIPQLSLWLLHIKQLPLSYTNPWSYTSEREGYKPHSTADLIQYVSVTLTQEIEVSYVFMEYVIESTILQELKAANIVASPLKIISISVLSTSCICKEWCQCTYMCIRRCNLIQIDGLVQERRTSSALVMELRLSCTNPSR